MIASFIHYEGYIKINSNNHKEKYFIKYIILQTHTSMRASAEYLNFSAQPLWISMFVSYYARGWNMFTTYSGNLLVCFPSIALISGVSIIVL